MKVYVLFLKAIIHPQEKTALFASFGGRNYDDSPKAVYLEMCKRQEFADWRFIWAFVDPEHQTIPRGEKIKIDTPAFFKALLYSKVWVSNSGMTRGITVKRNDVVSVETWHGTPLKKICGEENQNTLGGKEEKKGPLDNKTIRCAQSEYDRTHFARLFHADKDSILLCDLPRNDELVSDSHQRIHQIRSGLGIPEDKKVILYMPTYREYLVDENNSTYMAPPMDLQKWKRKLGDGYVLLMRLHYAVTKALDIQNDGFVYDVSKYPSLNELYLISDILISDYSSAFFDYAILDRPMLCFAYDLEEYEEKRGLYCDLAETLPCPIDSDEDSLIEHILCMNVTEYADAAKHFHSKYAPYAGNASKAVVDEIEHRVFSFNFDKNQ